MAGFKRKKNQPLGIIMRSTVEHMCFSERASRSLSVNQCKSLGTNNTNAPDTKEVALRAGVLGARASPIVASGTLLCLESKSLHAFTTSAWHFL